MKKQLIHDVVSALDELKESNPLVHVIPNSVTANLCADALSALGARSVMAISPSESYEISKHAESLIVNLGQPTEEKLLAVKYSLAAATKHRKPIVLDPVGAGASAFRRDAVKDITSMPWKGIIKGNMSEIQSILTKELQYNGVDNEYSLADKHLLEDQHPFDPSHTLLDLTQLVKSTSSQSFPSTTKHSFPTIFKDKNSAIKDKTLAITGDCDYIISKLRFATLNHKNKYTYKLVGSGCVAGCLCGAFAIYTDDFTASIAGLATLSLASQMAYLNSVGYGDYKIKLLDALTKITSPQLSDYLTEILVLKEENKS